MIYECMPNKCVFDFDFWITLPFICKGKTSIMCVDVSRLEYPGTRLSIRYGYLEMRICIACDFDFNSMVYLYSTTYTQHLIKSFLYNKGIMPKVPFCLHFSSRKCLLFRIKTYKRTFWRLKSGTFKIFGTGSETRVWQKWLIKCPELPVRFLCGKWWKISVVYKTSLFIIHLDGTENI